jgi:hypothetical protein
MRVTFGVGARNRELTRASGNGINELELRILKDRMEDQGHLVTRGVGRRQKHRSRYIQPRRVWLDTDTQIVDWQSGLSRRHGSADGTDPGESESAYKDSEHDSVRRGGHNPGVG